jgi:hypothetical protein
VGSMAVTEATRFVRWYAYAGCLAVVPFLVRGFGWPWYAMGLLFTVAGLGWWLLLGLLRPAATEVPAAVIWGVAAVLAVYGTASLAYHGAVTLDGLAAGGYGWALAVAALSYRRRYSAAVRSAAARISSRSAEGSMISASGPSPRSWV